MGGEIQRGEKQRHWTSTRPTRVPKIEAIQGALRCGSAPECALCAGAPAVVAVALAESFVVTVRSFTTPSMAIPVT